MAAIWPLLFKRQNLSIFPFTPPQKPPVTSLATVAVWGVFSSGSNIAAAITSQTFASLSHFRRAARYSGLNRPWRGGHHQPTPPHRPATKVPTSHSLSPSEGLFSWGRDQLFSWGRGLLCSEQRAQQSPLCAGPPASLQRRPVPASTTHAPLLHLAARLCNSGGFTEVVGGERHGDRCRAGVRLAPSHARELTRCAGLADGVSLEYANDCYFCSRHDKNRFAVLSNPHRCS